MLNASSTLVHFHVLTRVVFLEIKVEVFWVIMIGSLDSTFELHGKSFDYSADADEKPLISL